LKKSNQIEQKRGTTYLRKHHPIPSKINDLCRVHLREL
jgi:hypothetical protein